MKTVFLIFLLVHGLIHLMGFVKAYQLADVSQLTQDISKPAGALWLLAALLFIGTFLLLMFGIESWWLLAAPGLILSQTLIILSWTDAKYGTILNLLVLLPVIASFMALLPSSFENRYGAAVSSRLTAVLDTSVVTESDLQHLPPVVQNYLRYTGSVGRPRVNNFRAINSGAMKRSMESSWSDISAQQYNFFGDRARLFYIESAMFGIPFDGLHMYVDGAATMEIRVASTIKVVDARGEKMNQGETVTMFNDMCCLAPATLIDTTIRWEAVDSMSVKATFTNSGNTVSAILTFNEAGELINFLSNDRFLSSDGKTYLNYPWSTPVSNYKDFDGRKVAAYGEAIWHTPQGEFPYAKFNLKEIEYNCTELK
jgi:hypothetical protein